MRQKKTSRSAALSETFWSQLPTLANRCFVEKSPSLPIGRSLPPETQEWLITPLSNWSKDPANLSILPKDSFWNSATQLQWNRQKDLKSPRTDSRAKSPKEVVSETEARAFLIRSNDGSLCQTLWIPPQLSTFELHQEMRAAFESHAQFEETPHKTGTRSIYLNIQNLSTAEQVRVLHAAVYLATVANWSPIVFGKRALAHRKEPHAIRFFVGSQLSSEQIAEISHRATVLGVANCQVRTLADLPANALAPGSYRRWVRKFAEEKGLKYEFLETKQLEKLGAHAFLAVTRADSASQGGIAKVTYRPRTKGKPRASASISELNAGVQKPAPSLALIGKGVCFDTGGYNLKPGSSMLGMHGDMTGSALAISLLGALADLQFPFPVTAYLALAENLISPTGYKPNEVVTACDGTSIEVVDTDAEGRMLLADTLALARRERPGLALDFATLTGAAIRALDTRIAAVFSNDSRLAEAAVSAGEESGERTWRFPIGGDYRKHLKSKIADILQCSESSSADHIYAATFLSHFIGKETPWVHLDLTPAENKGGLGLIGSSTTGFGILWAMTLIERYFGENYLGKTRAIRSSKRSTR